MSDSPERFVADLAAARIGATVNPYSCHDPTLDRPGGASIRQENLRRHLVAGNRPALLLVGEAPSYRGCRFSGIAFTSERALPVADWSSTHRRGWTEPSASIVHRVLRELEIEGRTVLWNAVPMHPADDRPLSNRTPSKSELTAGLEWLDRVIALIQPEDIVAVGRSAGSVLPGYQAIRHPANGGARLFAEQLGAIVGPGASTIRYLALESNGEINGLARHVETSDAVSWEHIDRTTGEWVPSPSSIAAGWWTGIGGVTDAEPISAVRAADVARALRADPRRLDPVTFKWVSVPAFEKRRRELGGRR